MTEVHRFGNTFRSLGPHDYWHLPGLWAEIRTGLLAAKQRFPALASVGVDSWGVDHVLVNQAGRACFPRTPTATRARNPACSASRATHARAPCSTRRPASRTFSTTRASSWLKPSPPARACASHAAAMRRFEELTGRRFTRILLVGGGAKNPLLCQATADAAGRSVNALAWEDRALGNIASQLVVLRRRREPTRVPLHDREQFQPTIASLRWRS